MRQNSNDNLISVRSLRAALVNWYPFPGGARALVLGKNTGPLVPVLERYYSRVDAVREPGPLKTVYDCIVAADLVEGSEDVPGLLRQIAGILSENGVFLLAYRNRFGLKYLCGGVDEESPFAFACLQPKGDGPRLYARREMETMLAQAGFAKPRCYFLMPDAAFVQAVYTEDRLPDDSIRDRVFPFDLRSSPLLGWEGDLYDDVVREGTLPYVSNVYLAECRRPGAPAPHRQVVYAALSTDRGKENGFATVLYSDETARKIPLYPEGMKSLHNILANMEALKERGILTVDHRMTGDGIEMPLIREEGLLHYLRRQLPDHPEAFLAVFEQIRRDVLQSSAPAESLPSGLSEIWGADASRLAPVLEKAWIDMIPYNAFRSDGRIRYYDQEFCVENCPADYVLFRALHYNWLHIPEAEKVLPLESVKERFGLTGLWEGFRRREDRFVSENRNIGALEDIYSHAWPNRSAIAGLRRMLDPSLALQNVHRVHLELLKELDRVCRKNGLQYMAVHGTLLGAVRHHGFIPWDDDVDVAMLRKDYDRLLELGGEVFGEGFFLQTPENNDGCFYGGYSKLRRDGTSAVEPQNSEKDPQSCHQGIWIDILPIDDCPEDQTARKKIQRRLNRLQRLVYAKTYEPARFVPKDLTGTGKKLYYLLAGCLPRKPLLRMIDRVCRSRTGAPLRGIIACYYGGRENINVWPAEAVETVEEIPFEDMMLPVPSGYRLILTGRYGKKYMTPPLPEKRYRHSEVVFKTGERK